MTPRRRRQGSLLVAAIVWAAASGHASATEPASVEFIWDAPETCPTQSEVSARVQALLGAPLAQASSRRVSVIARVRAEGERWNMRLFTVTPEGTRERSLDHERCDLLAEATAVVVALAIDPSALGRLPADGDAVALVESASASETEAETEAETETETEAEAEAETEAETEAEAETESEAESEAEAGSDSRPRGVFGVQGALGWGALPRAAWALSAHAGLGWTHLRLEMVGRYWFRQSTRLPTPEGVGADLEMWTFGPRVCGVPLVSPIEVPICVGLEGGQIIARAVSLDRPRTVANAWAAAPISVGLAWSPVRILTLRADLEAAVALRRPAFDIEGREGLLHRARAADLRGLLGLELRFP